MGSSIQCQDQLSDMYNSLSVNRKATAQTQILNERRLNPFATPKRQFPVAKFSSDQIGRVMGPVRRPHSARTSSSSRCKMKLQRPSTARTHYESQSMASDVT